MRLVIGIDPGGKGGIVAIDPRNLEILYYAYAPPIRVMVRQAETDEKWDRGKKSKSTKVKRYKTTGELKPKSRSVFSSCDFQQRVLEAVDVGEKQGLTGVFVLLESSVTPVTNKNKFTGVVVMMSVGGCRNAWSESLHFLASDPDMELDLLWEEIHPSSWKAALNIRGGKELAVAAAKSWMSLPEDVACSEDLCEAALLAYLASTKMKRKVESKCK